MTTAISNFTVVPRTGEEPIRLITWMITTEFADVLEAPTVKIVPVMTKGSFSMLPAVCTTHYKGSTDKFLSIWLNASDCLTMGGRSVESGHGPNYYTTVGELKLAIKRAMWQLEHPDVDEMCAPSYEEFAERLGLQIGVNNGGVCSQHAERPTDGQGHKSRGELDMPGVIETLQRLKADGHILTLESFSGRKLATITKAEIDSRYPRLFAEFHFTKNKKWKADICQHLGLDVMIDDTFEVVQQVATQNPDMLVLWFQGDPSFVDERVSTVSNVRTVKNWGEAYDACTARLTEVNARLVTASTRVYLDEQEWNKRVYTI